MALYYWWLGSNATQTTLKHLTESAGTVWSCIHSKSKLLTTSVCKIRWSESKDFNLSNKKWTEINEWNHRTSCEVLVMCCNLFPGFSCTLPPLGSYEPAFVDSQRDRFIYFFLKYRSKYIVSYDVNSVLCCNSEEFSIDYWVQIWIASKTSSLLSGNANSSATFWVKRKKFSSWTLLRILDLCVDDRGFFCKSELAVLHADSFLLVCLFIVCCWGLSNVKSLIRWPLAHL